jgi:hypothetical protein
VKRSVSRMPYAPSGIDPPTNQPTIAILTYFGSRWPRGLRHAWTLFARSEAGIVGSNPTQRHRCLCLRLFSFCIVLCVGSGLVTGWSLIQRALPTVYKRLRNWRRGQGPTKGCRTVDEWKWMNAYFGSTNRAIAQAVSRQLPTPAARVRAQVRSCGISQSTSVSPTNSHSPNASYSLSIIRGSYNRPISGRRTK